MQKADPTSSEYWPAPEQAEHDGAEMKNAEDVEQRVRLAHASLSLDRIIHVSPPNSAYRPTGHKTHDDPSMNVPGGQQREQASASLEVVERIKYLPAAHAVQLLEETPLYEPETQSEQASASLEVAALTRYLPAAQGLHDDEETPL